MDMLNKKITDDLDDIINYIISSKNYCDCIELKKTMLENKELTTKINLVKKYQKEYIKSNYNNDIKKMLDQEITLLNNIPIYVIYNENLESVNQMINLVKEELNEYFYQKLNKDIKF